MHANTNIASLGNKPAGQEVINALFDDQSDEHSKTESIDDQLADMTAQFSRASEYVRTWEIAMMKAVGEDGVGSVVEAIDMLKLQRDTAWRELSAIRKLIGANPDESTFDEVQRVVSSTS